MRPGIAPLIAACVLIAGPGRADDPAKKDLASLQGRWVMVGREMMGKKATKEDLEIVKGIMVIEGNKVTSWPEDMGKKGDDVQEATIRLDSAAKPKTIDKTVTKGLSKGETYQGIYELNGDQLTICMAWQSKERPTEFAGKPDGKAILAIYKQVKK